MLLPFWTQERVKAESLTVHSSLRLIIVVAWMVILAILSWVTISPGVPTILRPLNLLVVIPLFVCGEPSGTCFITASLLVPAVFGTWCFGMILQGSPNVPARSYVLLAVIGLLSLVDFIGGTRFAIGYHGLWFVIGTALLSVLWWVTLGMLAYFAELRPSFQRNLCFHLALFAWLAWYALPYLGELP
jgi:hypothetical protein